MVIVIARFRPLENGWTSSWRCSRTCRPRRGQDDGCVAYGYHREIVDDMAFIAVEEWRDMAALRHTCASRTWRG